MNRDDTTEAIKVMQAWADGKTVQVSVNGEWRSIAPWEELGWSWDRFEYRIKPEPRVVYGLVDHQGRLGSGLYNEADAKSAVAANNSWAYMRKFIEVIE